MRERMRPKKWDDGELTRENMYERDEESEWEKRNLMWEWKREKVERELRREWMREKWRDRKLMREKERVGWEWWR